jgi:tetratricopeptide (TPR) repeat protein
MVGSAMLVLLLTDLVLRFPGSDVPVAQAQTNESMDNVRKKMEQGQAFFLAGKYSEALDAFQKAYAAKPFAAFIFNQAVCYEKLNNPAQAIATFERFLREDPQTPDRAAIQQRIERLKARLTGAGSPTTADGGADGGEGGSVGDGGAKQPADLPEATMKSLVYIESDPIGAPVALWKKVNPQATAFRRKGNNAGWVQISKGNTPLAVAVETGSYHIVLEPWQTYNYSETKLEVLPGHIHHFKANLSQGAFMGFFRVNSPNKEAEVYIDDPPPHKKDPWGKTPHGELLPAGKHKMWVEAPGYETDERSFTIKPGEPKTMDIKLERLNYGYLLVHGNASKIHVFLDGDGQGIVQSDQVPLKIKASKGQHLLRAETDGKKTFEGTVTVSAGQIVDVNVVFVNKYGRGTAWFAAIGATAFIGTGIYLGIKSNEFYDDLQNDRRRGVLTEGDDRARQGKLLAQFATASYTLGGLLAGLAIFEFLRDPLPPSGSRQGEPFEFDDKKKLKEYQGNALIKTWKVLPGYSPQTATGTLWLMGSFLP